MRLFVFIFLLFNCSFSFSAEAKGVSNFFSIEGNWCEGSYWLIAHPKRAVLKQPTTYLWKKNGLELPAEGIYHTNSINLAKFGAGNYEVVILGSGGDTLVKESYHVANLPGPKAAFSFDYNFAAGVVKFKNQSEYFTATDLKFHWDFGDGTKLDQENFEEKPVEHFYKKQGAYTVTLTVEAPDGCTNAVSVVVNWVYPTN